MKTPRLLVAFAAVVLSIPAIGGEIPLGELLGPNQSLKDPVYGLSVTYPPGWKVESAMRWGPDDRENTIFFRAPAPSIARPSLYYQMFRPDSPRPTDFDAYFRDVAQKKEAQRRQRGGDYRNAPESYTVRKIGGQTAFSYTAFFTAGGRVMAEYFVRVVGEKGYAMFFSQTPVEELAAIQKEVDGMADTLRVP